MINSLIHPKKESFSRYSHIRISTLFFYEKLPQLNGFRKGKTPVALAVSQDFGSKKIKKVKITDISQAKLNLGFYTPIVSQDPRYAAMQVCNAVFGGGMTSKLFMNVREKESLAYYALSSYSGHYGLVFVLAGIEAANEEKAYTLIQQQLTAMQQGDMTELELAQTKAMLTNQLKEALDSARGQIEVYDQYKELDEQFSIDTWAARWDRITLDDVARMAKYVTLEKVYFLSGKEQE